MTNSSEDGSDSAPDGGDGPTSPGEGRDGGASRREGGARDGFSGLPAERTFPGGNAERDHVIVLPPKDDDPTWRSPRSVRWWAWIPVLLLVGYGVYEARQRGWLDLVGSSPQTRPPAMSTEERAAALERAEAERRFRQVADSLSSAVQGYDVRRSDFEQNRIGCGLLAAGYRRVDRYFVQLSVLMKERGSRLDADATSRYEALTERVDEVNRHFDGTACRADA